MALCRPAPHLLLHACMHAMPTAQSCARLLEVNTHTDVHACTQISASHVEGSTAACGVPAKQRVMPSRGSMYVTVVTISASWRGQQILEGWAAARRSTYRPPMTPLHLPPPVTTAPHSDEGPMEPCSIATHTHQVFPRRFAPFTTFSIERVHINIFQLNRRKARHIETIEIHQHLHHTQFRVHACYIQRSVQHMHRSAATLQQQLEGTWSTAPLARGRQRTGTKAACRHPRQL